MKDPEIKAMEVVVEYFEASNERTRQRFIYHLVHRYFPEGQFNPNEEKIDWSLLSDRLKT